MSGDEPGSQQAELAALRSAIDSLAASAEPDSSELERLADRAHGLTHSGDAEVAGEARRLELRALGALLACQAAGLRQLARQLQRLARMLPPRRPELN
jgi:hypothetical protein